MRRENQSAQGELSVMNSSESRVKVDVHSIAAQPLESLMESAWDIRFRSFGADIEWVNPIRTAVLSVTGTACALNCGHCGGEYLKHMLPIERWRELNPSEISSCLISGGCDGLGRVPIDKYIELIPELASKWKLNMHLGLASEEVIRKIAPFCSVASFDFVVDDDTIREVYGFRGSKQIFLKTYNTMGDHIRVVPHICIGLRAGQISGELDAVRALADIGADAIVFIVFIPTPGTRYQGSLPPPVEGVVRIIATARCIFPTTPIYLGCMRPHGRYRHSLDSMAIRAGVNRIVAPTGQARAEAQTLGLNSSWIEECCAL